MQAAEKVILEAYKKAFRRHYRDNEIAEPDKTSVIRFDWILLRLEDIIPVFGLAVPPFRHVKFSIVYVEKGKGEKTIGDITVPVKDRTLMIVPAQTLTATTFSETVKGFHLSFNLDFFLQEPFPHYHFLQLDIFKQKITPFAYPGPRKGKQLSAIFEAILEEREHQRKNKQELIALKILELIIQCNRQLKTEKNLAPNDKHPLMVQYIELIQQHYKKQHVTSFYAQQLHIHPNALNAATQRYLSQPAKSLIATRLLNEARSLLRFTSLSVKEIAYELGFQSPSSFFRFFKRLNGNPPEAYRREHLKLS